MADRDLRKEVRDLKKELEEWERATRIWQSATFTHISQKKKLADELENTKAQIIDLQDECDDLYDKYVLATSKVERANECTLVTIVSTIIVLWVAAVCAAYLKHHG